MTSGRKTDKKKSKSGLSTDPIDMQRCPKVCPLLIPCLTFYENTFSNFWTTRMQQNHSDGGGSVKTPKNLAAGLLAGFNDCFFV